MLKEFRAFIMRGNVLDLAVGVMVGGAFQKIVTSFVNDVLTPIISIFTSGIELGDLFFVISPAVTEGDAVIKEAAVFRYGMFLQSVVDFLIIAFCIFLLVKAINNARKKFEKSPEPEAPPPTEAPAKEQELLCEIRDLLKEQSRRT